jgi:hypothetical protein
VFVSYLNVFLLLLLAEFIPKFGWLWNKSLEKPVYPPSNQPGVSIKSKKTVPKTEVLE